MAGTAGGDPGFTPRRHRRVRGGRRAALRRARWGAVVVTVMGVVVGTVVVATPPAVGTSTGSSGSFARTFDVGGGRRMFLECQGTGSPTVVFEAGYRNRGDVWSAQPDPKHPIRTVEPAVAKFTRVCTYDRPGTTLDVDKTSRSDPVPNPRTARDVVADLHTLLATASVPGPYVLVGHSLGGLFVRLYTSTYPHDVAGMVLADALPEQIQGLLGPDDWARYHALVAATPTELASYADLEMIDVTASFEQMRQAAAARPLPPIPLTVVARGKPVALPSDVPAGFSGRLERAWRIAQRQLAALVPGGHLVVARHASHYVQFDEPSVVINATRRVVDAVRRSRR